MNYQESENNNNSIYLSQWPVLLSLTTKKKNLSNLLKIFIKIVISILISTEIVSI
jgi:hypothetical protein